MKAICPTDRMGQVRSSHVASITIKIRPHAPRRDHDLQPLCIQGHMQASMRCMGEILHGLASSLASYEPRRMWLVTLCYPEAEKNCVALLSLTSG